MASASSTGVVGLWAEWGPLSATPPTPEPGGGGANACRSAEEEVHTIPYLHLPQPLTSTLKKRNQEGYRANEVGIAGRKEHQLTQSKCDVHPIHIIYQILTTTGAEYVA